MADSVNITPNPRILEVISCNAMRPIDAICELIDNSIDSFTVAKEAGIEIEEPCIDISIPKKKEIEKGVGEFIIKDNGPGLPQEKAIKAVTAGFSGNNPFDRLGLFGVGFNISTGKMGKITTLTSSTQEDESQYSIEINIPEMVKSGNFDAPLKKVFKQEKNTSGTSVCINNWWEKGHQNFGFISKLANISKPQLRKQISRRYSFWLRKGLKIVIDEQECEVFHHCIWDKSRYVNHRDLGKIPAVFNFNEEFGIERHCNECWALMDEQTTECPECGSKDNFKDRKQTVTGWVGIQRFDDINNFGIDLLRNGRVIKVSEKEAFFTWTTADGTEMRDYPYNGPYGRIVGEVHLNHVPVDFMKTDFNRTSADWATAIEFLRGASSIRPKIREQYNEPENHSPIYKLYQGYNNVRNYGKSDLYMGYWDEETGKSKRISREKEKELLEKFEAKDPGFGPKDDSKWFELVEQADERPKLGFTICDQCNYQNGESAEVCESCGKIFKAKECKKCGKEIAFSETVCTQCQAPQVAETTNVWNCNHCGRKHNPPTTNYCLKCKTQRGVVNIFTKEWLQENSNLVESLSRQSVSIPLPENAQNSFKLNTYFLKTGRQLEKAGIEIPLHIEFKINELDFYIVQDHKAFRIYQDRPEDFISMEIARFLIEQNQGQINPGNRPLWSLSNIYCLSHENIWKESVAIDADKTKINIDNFIEDFTSVLPTILQDVSEDIWVNLDDLQKSQVQRIYFENVGNAPPLNEISGTSEYLKYLPDDLFNWLLERYPENFFDSQCWDEQFNSLDTPDPAIKKEIQDSIITKYSHCLIDIMSFKKTRKPDPNYVIKINQSLKILNQKLCITQS